MNKLSNKLSVLSVSLICLLLPLQAQTVPFTFAGTSPVVLQMDSYGTLSSIGTFGTGTLSLSGANTMMLWYPGKAAFRAGNITGSQWNDSNIGPYSVAFGLNNTASGYYSLVAGANSKAQLDNTVAFGWNTVASGYNSVSMGEWTTASGTDSMALGATTSSTNFASVSLNTHTLASGYASTALNYATTASGTDSISAGNQTMANSYASFVIGQFNIGLSESGATPNLLSWISTASAADPLFEVGDGASGGAPSDALVVYKDGVVAVHTKLRCAAAGDISMGSFTTGTAP